MTVTVDFQIAISEAATAETKETFSYAETWYEAFQSLFQ
jgi:hypothetical protein